MAGRMWQPKGRGEPKRWPRALRPTNCAPPVTLPVPTNSTTSPRWHSVVKFPPRTRLAPQNEVVEKLKSGLNGMKEKLTQLQTKRSELIARAKTASAQNKVNDAVKSI